MLYRWTSGLYPFILSMICIVILMLFSLDRWIRCCIGFFGLGSTFGGAYFFYQYISNQLYVRQSEQILQHLNRLRHDRLNYVQVVMGYCSMNKIDRIHPYLHGVVDQLKRERNISRISYSPLALALVMLQQRYSEWNWEVDVEEGFDVYSVKEGKKVLKMVQSFIRFFYNEKLPNHDNEVISIRIGRKEGVPFIALETSEKIIKRVKEKFVKERFQKKVVGSALIINISDK